MTPRIARLLVCLPLLVAAAAHAQPEQLAAKVVALWRTPASLPPDLRAPIEALDALTTYDIRALLASDDPHARGVGLYLANREALEADARRAAQGETVENRFAQPGFVPSREEEAVRARERNLRRVRELQK